MNKSYFKKYTVLAFSAILSLSAAAQTSDYAKVDKSATYNYETGTGEITLESYVTGVSKVTQEAKPLEIVMVLDYSTSMKDESYTSSETYTKVVASKRYYAGNTKVGSSYVSSYSSDITGSELKNNSGTNITVNYNGSNKQVYLIRRGSSSSSYNWLYINDNDNKRVFIRQDGSFVKEYGVASSIKTSYSTWPKESEDLYIFPVKADDRTFFCELGESTGNSITVRADALRAAAANFIDEIYAHATTNNVTDRIGIVVFQGGKTDKYQAIYQTTNYNAAYITKGSPMFLNEFPTDMKGSGTSNDGSIEARSFIAKRFVDLSSQNAQKILKFAIADRLSKGNTEVGVGLEVTNLLVDNFSRDESNLAKVVIIFSDGEPTDSKYTSVDYAHQLKEKGWTVYSVYCHNNDPKDADFMDYLSSNYPDATATSTKITPGDKITPSEKAIYYKTAKQDLSVVFANLTQEITQMAGIQYGTETLLKDFVNNTYFKMPENITKFDVKVYEQLCTGMSGTSPNITYTFNDVCIDSGTGANRLWHKGSGHTPAPIEITINQAGVTPGYTGTQDQVLISGYDYSADENWCGLHKSTSNPTGTVRGHRLVVKFPYEIKVKTGQTATGTLETNGSDSGIYEAQQDSTGKKPGEEGYTPTYDETPEAEYPMPVVYFASLNITRTGLDPGESAIYDIYQTIPGGTKTKVGRLSINGSGTGSDSKIMYGLAGGVGVTYEVVETDWNWAYHNGTLPTQSQTIAAKSSTEPTVPASSNITYTFTGDHQSAPTGQEATSPYSMFNHDEEFKVNKMTIGTTP